MHKTQREQSSGHRPSDKNADEYEGNSPAFIHASGRRRIGKINLPERAANLCFGGARRNRLFIAGSQSIYALYVNAQGATLS